MKSNRGIFGVKGITNLIYGLIILLPMFSILGRVIYTQSNMNSKDSYYGSTINESSIIGTNVFKQNVTYTYSYLDTDMKNLVRTVRLSVEDFSLLSCSNTNTYNNLKNVESSIFQIYWWVNTNANNQQNITFIYLDSNDTSHDIVVSLYSDVASYIFLEFSFLSKTNKTVSNTDTSNNITYIVYNKYSYLDNAFEYSLDTFVKDNNLGNVDMFGWFTDMFLSNSNSKNNLYVGFVNWYLNYAMLVSSGYLLFLVLIWFINYVRKIMDKSMYHDFGGF